MNYNNTYRPHLFHIPVMGTSFTIDTPLNVAKYGISSAISLVDDVLIEKMREYHSHKAGILYNEIKETTENKRSLRICSYLNLLNDLVEKQVAEIKNSCFTADSEITKYFEMMPDSKIKLLYREMLDTEVSSDKNKLQEELRNYIKPGNIDVNVMTYLNFNNEAAHAVKGYAESKLRSSIILSAGINPSLYRYMSNFKDFYPDGEGIFKKKIILKVSDYRSALIQGKMLAKLGLWVSEFRIESGLNCGGHAFATKGHLIGPILEEFKCKRKILFNELSNIYIKALDLKNINLLPDKLDLLVTMQGGIGTSEENFMILDHYNINGTGWGTPFLLCPEVTTMDKQTLQKLVLSKRENVYLSQSSPVGLPFWILKTSFSELSRKQSNSNDDFGYCCIREKGYVRYNTEFTDKPVCVASKEYIVKKLKNLEDRKVKDMQKEYIKDFVINKVCLCKELADTALLAKGIISEGNPSVCCGPNIANYSEVASLRAMTDHIYGRNSLLANPERLHIFVEELGLYIDFLNAEIDKKELNISEKKREYFYEFIQNLIEGYNYYKEAGHICVNGKPELFRLQLDGLNIRLNDLHNRVNGLFPYEDNNI